MRRLTAFVLVVALLFTACSDKIPEGGIKHEQTGNNENSDSINIGEQTNNDDAEGKTYVEETESQKENDAVESETDDDIYREDVPLQEYYSPEDPVFLQHIEDEVYTGIVEEYACEDYILEDLEVRYYSDEYLEHLEYNSRENIWFGYTLSEVDDFFGDEKYVFTLAENGTTTVTSVENYNSAWENAIKDVAVGMGVIGVCIVISSVSADKTISITFLTAAKEGAKRGFLNGVKAAIFAAIKASQETGDFESILEEAVTEGAYEFKWSVIETVSDSLNVPIRRKDRDAEPVQWEIAKQRVIKKYGGSEDKAYKDGEEVNIYTIGAFRPSVVVSDNGIIEAIEVAYYDLLNEPNVENMHEYIRRKITSGIENLPEGATQRIVLDVSGRGYSKELVERIVEEIQDNLKDIYINIPVDVIGGGI